MGHTGSAENHPAIPAEHHKIRAGTGNRSGGELFDRERVAAGAQTVDVLKQIVFYRLFERVENDIDAFTQGEFGGRDKITVTVDHDDLVDLMLKERDAMSMPIFISTPFCRMESSKSCGVNSAGEIVPEQSFLMVS